MKKLIKYDSYSAITIANDVLTKGGIIAYPTDTLYGLGCNAKNDSAIKNLNKSELFDLMSELVPEWSNEKT